jgi:endonuclease/exonuclease/phosphatase (EEP) superfamily protein YafD
LARDSALAGTRAASALEAVAERHAAVLAALNRCSQSATGPGDGGTATMRGEGSARRALRLALWAVALLLIAATVLPLVPTDDWWIRALDFPRPVFAALLLLVVLAVLVLFGQGWARWTLLAAALAALSLQLHRIRPYTPLHPMQAPAVGACGPENRLSLVAANLREGSSGAGPFLAAVRRADPDLVFVVEVDQGWVEALVPLEARYPYRVLHPRDDFWGLALYSRHPLVEAEVRHLLRGYVPSLRTELRLGSGAVVEFHGLHPKPPLPSEGTGQRDAELLLAARAARDSGAAAVVAGDLNAVAWSAITALFQRIGGLLDPRVGRGPFVTFPTWLPAALRVPIDHVFFTPEFSLLALERLPDIGSDHLPLLAHLCHTPGEDTSRGFVPEPSAANLQRAEEAIRDGREDAPREPPTD